VSVPGTPAATASSPQSIAQWLALLAASAAIGAAFAWLRVPAALLLGPMLAGIAIAAGGGSARVPNWAFLLAQGLIGCMIANMAPLAIASEILSRWPVFVFGVLAVIAVSTLLGWWMTRMHILPGTAVLWGSSPGAATAMIVMAEAHGPGSCCPKGLSPPAVSPKGQFWNAVETGGRAHLGWRDSARFFSFALMVDDMDSCQQ